MAIDLKTRTLLRTMLGRLLPGKPDWIEDLYLIIRLYAAGHRVRSLYIDCPRCGQAAGRGAAHVDLETGAVFHPHTSCRQPYQGLKLLLGPDEADLARAREIEQQMKGRPRGIGRR